MLKKALAVILILLSFNIFFFGKPVPYFGELGYLLFLAVIHSSLWVAFYRKTFERKDKLALASTGIAMLSASLSVTKASGVDVFLLGSLSVVFSFVSFYLLSLSHNVFGAVSEIVFIPLKLLAGFIKSSLGVLPNTFAFLSGSFSFLAKFLPERSISSRFMGVVARGLVITLPVIGVIVILLGQADPIFAKFVEDIFNFKINLPNFIISIPDRVLQSLVIIGLAVPMVLLKIESKFISPLQNKVFGKFKGEILMLISAIVFVLGAFLLIQFRYLFATVSETQLHQFGVNTYSEYVRKGFVEMTMVSVIVYLVSVASLLVHRASEKKKELLKNLNLVLLFEILVFIGSVFRRVLLYQVEHGLTRIRVYGMTFLLMIIGLTIVLWLRQVKTNFKNWYLYEIGIVVAMVFFSTMINVDNLVATTFQPTVNEEVDYTYIARLSTDGLEGWEQSWDWVKETAYLIESNQIDAENRQRHLFYAYLTVSSFERNYRNLIAQYGTKEEEQAAGLFSDIVTHNDIPSWYQFSFANWQAYQKLKDMVSYDEVKAVHSRIQDLYRASMGTMNGNVQYDRSSNTPLL